MTQVGAPIIRFYSDRGKVDFVDLSVDYRDYLEKGGEYFEMDRNPVNMRLNPEIYDIRKITFEEREKRVKELEEIQRSRKI